MKEIKVSFSITLLLDRCDVNYVEEELLKKREEVFKEIMVRVFDGIERERLQQGIKCPACEGEAIKKGSEGRKIETLIGEFRYTRTRVKCKELGAAFSQRVMVSKNRFLLLDKKSYASIESVEDFGEKFFMECVRQGVLNAGKVYFISDGAAWIRGVKENYFPSSIGVLDIWHIERELKKTLGEKRMKAVESLKQLALSGNAQGIIDRLTLIKRRANIEEAEKIEATIHYIETNREWIGNIPKVDGYGSGPVEKTVDITVARRLKKRGMSWHKDSANPLLKLRLLRLNGDWDSYWLKRKKDRAMFLAA